MKYGIRNGITGTWVHKSLFEIMAFDKRLDAWAFIENRHLNPKYYEVEVIWR